jgi:hypothetical protein
LEGYRGEGETPFATRGKRGVGEGVTPSLLLNARDMGREGRHLSHHMNSYTLNNMGPYAAHLQHIAGFSACELALIECITSMKEGIISLTSEDSSTRALAARIVAAKLA